MLKNNSMLVLKRSIAIDWLKVYEYLLNFYLPHLKISQPFGHLDVLEWATELLFRMKKNAQYAHVISKKLCNKISKTTCMTTFKSAKQIRKKMTKTKTQFKKHY